MWRAIFLIVAFYPALALSEAAPTDKSAGRVSGTVAVLNTLDKITARISRLEAPLDTPVRFEALEITLRACIATPPEEAPESTAFLEIRELKPGAEPAVVFSGWMFASSPAVSAMEHAVYDVWVIACKTASPGKSSGKAKKSAVP
ncbi:MAG: DUF2155 domain-containing protein [Proteobacteria bacterium]|nr:MAG: DUF2155 domain-containing protein [Pseudomonadota bacterium]